MRTCTKIMALLGLTATSQAASSFNTQISVSAQQERAANLAQTSTAVDQDDSIYDSIYDQKTFFQYASIVISWGSDQAYYADYYCHTKELNYFFYQFYDLEYTMLYICDNFRNDNLFSSFNNLDVYTQQYLDSDFQTACWLGEISTHIYDQIQFYKSIWDYLDTGYCNIFTYDFKQVLDNVSNIILQQYNCTFNDIFNFGDLFLEQNSIDVAIYNAVEQCESGDLVQVYLSLDNLYQGFSDLINDTDWDYLGEKVFDLADSLSDAEVYGAQLSYQLYGWREQAANFDDGLAWTGGLECKDIFKPIQDVSDEIFNAYAQGIADGGWFEDNDDDGWFGDNDDEWFE